MRYSPGTRASVRVSGMRTHRYRKPPPDASGGGADVLGDLVHLQVPDLGADGRDADFGACLDDLLGVRLGLIAAPPHLDHSHQFVVADRGDVHHAAWRRGIAQAEVGTYLLVLFGGRAGLDDSTDRHDSLLSGVPTAGPLPAAPESARPASAVARAGPDSRPLRWVRDKSTACDRRHYDCHGTTSSCFWCHDEGRASRCTLAP